MASGPSDDESAAARSGDAGSEAPGDDADRPPAESEGSDDAEGAPAGSEIARPARDAVDGLVTTRRAALAAAVAAAVAGVGWYRTRPVTARSPEAVADRFYGALAEGDVEAANERLHPETPWAPVEEAEAAAVADAGVFVAETSTHDIRGDESRMVVAIVLRARAPGDDAERSRTRTVYASLRTDDGAWFVWDPRLDEVLDWLAR